MYSYSVFFKPLAEHFQWDRATVSLVYSASLIIRGAISIGIGWLADKYGAARVMAFCGLMIGMGLVLSSQVNSLWQFFITYALIESAGLSGTFGIATAITSRWFTKNRGLALGIVSSGVGLGYLFMVPASERLINAAGWSQAFIICGLAAGTIMIASAFFLRPAPRAASISKAEPATGTKPHIDNQPAPAEMTLMQAVRSSRIIIMTAAFTGVFFSTQIVMVHLVNYATDIGITPLVAATFISIIGIASVAGRLMMGIGADRLGIYNTLIFCCVLLMASLILLVFTHSLWAFYVFAIIFGFSYGGEVPQIPLFVVKFGGTRAMAALMGLTLFICNIGGAIGPWVAGKIFDISLSYQWAFIGATAVAAGSLIMALVLKKKDA